MFELRGRLQAIEPTVHGEAEVITLELWDDRAGVDGMLQYVGLSCWLLVNRKEGQRGRRKVKRTRRDEKVVLVAIDNEG